MGSGPRSPLGQEKAHRAQTTESRSAASQQQNREAEANRLRRSARLEATGMEMRTPLIIILIPGQAAWTLDPFGGSGRNRLPLGPHLNDPFLEGY